MKSCPKCHSVSKDLDLRCHSCGYFFLRQITMRVLFGVLTICFDIAGIVLAIVFGLFSSPFWYFIFAYALACGIVSLSGTYFKVTTIVAGGMYLAGALIGIAFVFFNVYVFIFIGISIGFGVPLLVGGIKQQVKI